MQQINNSTDLKLAIQLMETTSDMQWMLVKDEVLDNFKKLQPLNIIKNTIHGLTTSPDFKGDVVNATLSIASGYISKKVIVGKTHNPLKQLFGTLLQIGVTDLVAKNTDGIKLVGNSLFRTIFPKKQSSV